MSKTGASEINEIMNTMAGGHRHRLKRRAKLLLACVRDAMDNAHRSDGTLYELVELETLLEKWLQS